MTGLRGLWRYWRALQLMGRHERWRVAMGCPGVPPILGREQHIDPTIPRRGEVYCRCERCHAARRLVGWEPLRDAAERPRPTRPSPMGSEP